MDMDIEAYPIDYIINYNEHLDCKSYEKKKKQKQKENLTMKNKFLREKSNKKVKMNFVHTGNMVMLSKNNCFFF